MPADDTDAEPPAPCSNPVLIVLWTPANLLPFGGVPTLPPPPAAPAEAELPEGSYSSSKDYHPGLERRVETGFDWNGALRDSAVFLAVEHSYRIGMQPGTRLKLGGAWFREWFASASLLRGWRDGDDFLTNYIGHPMQGAVSGFIQIRNDPGGRAMTFSADKQYFKSRTKAAIWSALYGLQFELGPISESSVGNIGREAGPRRYSPHGYVDLVVTPTVGTFWLVGEDALDRYVITKLENRIGNRVAKVVVRSILNPSRSFANMTGGKWPWHRDSRAPNP